MKSFFYIALFLFFVACEQPSDSPAPGHLLPKSEMINVLVDIQLVEAHYHNLFQRPDVYANALDSATYFVFEKHHITKEIYKENLQYYNENPDTLFSIYESALDTINNRLNTNHLR